MTINEMLLQVRLNLNDKKRKVYTDFEIRAAIKASIKSVQNTLPLASLHDMISESTGTTNADINVNNITVSGLNTFIAFSTRQGAEVGGGGVGGYSSVWGKPWDFCEMNFLEDVKNAESNATFENTTTRLVSHLSNEDQFAFFPSVPSGLEYRFRYIQDSTLTGEITLTTSVNPNVSELVIFRATRLISKDIEITKKYLTFEQNTLAQITEKYLGRGV